MIFGALRSDLGLGMLRAERYFTLLTFIPIISQGMRSRRLGHRKDLMGPEHAVGILDLCKEKFRQVDEHLKDAPANREKIVEHDTRINCLEQVQDSLAKAVDRMKGVKMTVILSAAGIILTIVLAMLAVSTQWGSAINQIRVNTGRLESLEAIHPRMVK